MTEEFKKIIDGDIEKCEQEVKSGNKISRGNLTSALEAKYNSVIDGFGNGLLDLWFDDDGKCVLENTKILLEKLQLFKAMGYKNAYAKSESGISINNNNTNTNTLDVNITFKAARESIENMTALPDSEVDEILNKISELERIVQSSDRKTKKWENAKGIIKWIADKGVDVGIALLPLLMQIK